MRIVVTGGTGKAGRWVVRDLRDRGHDVLGVDLVRSTGPHGSSLAVDLTDLGQCLEVIAGADAVVHLAAIPAPEIHPDGETFRNNILSTYNVFAAAVLHRVSRVVWASSETVLGLPFDRPPAYAPIDEGCEPRPESSYSLSKLLGEEMARQANRRSAIPFVSLRISNIMEPDDYAAFPGYWDDARLRKWNLWGYVDVRDVAQAVRRGLEAPIDGAEICIIAAADTVMPRPSAELMAEVFPDVPLTRPVHGRETLLSIDRAREVLGYVPEHAWQLPRGSTRRGADMTAGDPIVTMVAPGEGRARLRPIDARGSRVEGGFWGDRVSVNRERTIPHGLAQLEVSGALGNFRNAARGTGLYVGGMDDAGITFPFLDSDIYKWLEAVGWELGRASDADLHTSASEVVDLVAAAQRPDGYLNTFVQLSGRQRWSDLQWGHELYCIGHLLQAAVAWQRAVGDDRLLSVARAAVDCIDRELGPDGRDGIDGHPEIEMALVELFRVTGEERYLRLARHHIEQRGRGLLGEGRYGAGYWQDKLHVREAPSVVGHSVRQLYLDSGAVDVAVETGDEELLAAVVRRWEDMRATRMYLTGGVGSRHRDEAFGVPFELPPDRAYTETCAAIASVMLAWRLLLATGEARYADLIERTLLDAVLPGLSHDGLAFFYVNPLHRRAAVPPATVAGRRPWYPCACCPPNVMRTLSSFEQLLATTDATGLQIHQYASAAIAADVAGEPLELRVATDYPWDGRVSVVVERTPGRAWTLGLRIPTWCSAWGLSVGGEMVDAVAADGRVSLERDWQPGDRVELDLAMPARFTVPDPRIDAVRGTIAVERGPLVYCLEDADLPAGVALADVALDTGRPPQVAAEPDPRLSTRPIAVSLVHRPRPPAAWPYPALADGTAAAGSDARLEVTLQPYNAWANRGDGAMRVFIPEA